ALLAAVAEDGFRRLRHAIARAARTHARDPVAALRAMAIAVVRFAAAHPSHYRLMSGPAVRGRDHPAPRDAAVGAWALLAGATRRSTRASSSASTTFISYIANAAPRHRRSPPPNGRNAYGLGRAPTNRSGANRSGSGQRSGRWWVK